MKIGLDYHGVISSSPEFFAVMSKLFIDNGHEVHIITGNDVDIDFLRKIESLNIKYTNIFSIVGYQKKLGTQIEWKEDGPWMNKEIWDRAKSEYCKKHRIDLMIDDTSRYGEYFKTPFIHWQKIK